MMAHSCGRLDKRALSENREFAHVRFSFGTLRRWDQNFEIKWALAAGFNEQLKFSPIYGSTKDVEWCTTHDTLFMEQATLGEGANVI